MNHISEKYAYDPYSIPEGMMQFVVVSGSWYDMGKQYAQQCKRGIYARTANLMADFLEQFHSETDVYEVAQQYLYAAQKDFPQLQDLLNGMAEELSLPWEEMVLVLYGKSMLRAERECSQVAAWDSMTADGHMIGAGNMDLPFDAREYLPAILAFPEDGYAFISSDMFHRAALNEKGLMVQGSGGQNAGKKDMIKDFDRHMWNDAFIYTAAYCDSVEQALNLHKSWKYIAGCNQGFADKNHHAAIVEFTASKYYVRKAGDFSETDYILANNGYNHPNMQDSLMTGEQYWTDCLPRYWTAEKYLKEHEGTITIQDMCNVQGLNRFYIPKGWSLDYRENWDTMYWYADDRRPFPPGWQESWDPMYNCFGLQCRDYSFRTTVRHVIDVDTLSFYLQKGCHEPVLSAQPNTTGTFCRIQLGGGVYDVINRAREELEKELWKAVRIDMTAKIDNADRRNLINEAKKCMYQGINLLSLSVCAKHKTNPMEQNLYAGRALTSFCQGQCLAKAAVF